MAWKPYKKKSKPCASPLPKPALKVCPIDGCGEGISDNHWACMLHWERFPIAFRLYGNLYKGHWAGDPDYDAFIVKANTLNAEIEAEIEALEARGAV